MGLQANSAAICSRWRVREPPAAAREIVLEVCELRGRRDDSPDRRMSRDELARAVPSSRHRPLPSTPGGGLTVAATFPTRANAPAHSTGTRNFSGR